MAESWQPIYLSAKVFGHLSQGLYRTPAGAIKELISNSFDADAKLVRIHTGFPRFETFSCEDNGTGMSQDEFVRLMNRGIGSSYKRTSENGATKELGRPLIGRLGIGILSLAQICTRFEIVSHHKESKCAFRATIQFPPYTRAEMDKIAKFDDDNQIHGGQYQIVTEKYDTAKQGLRVYTKYLREPFRRRMRSSLRHLANKEAFGSTQPYKTFESYLNAIYNLERITPSLNLRSDYDQLLFGLALAPPLPLVESRNVAAKVPMISDRQAKLKKFNFHVQVDNISLAVPVCLPFTREGYTAKDCSFAGSETRTFDLVDGPVTESCAIMQYNIAVHNSDLKFRLYEIDYSKDKIAGTPLAFKGYLFQQTGRLYPRDIQGVLIRLNNVAIGKYDNSMLTYPLAEGPRYSMISSELFVERGFEDALNIDRDSFNELHPHYIRVQSYIHSLLHELIFPETWGEEKKRNRERRNRAAAESEARFVQDFGTTTGETVRSIQRIEQPKRQVPVPSAKQSPVDFQSRRGRIEIDLSHPLLRPLFRRRKYAALIEKLVVAFERSNAEPSSARRRELFYKLLAKIFSES
jgi:Histidine kinase-, DNA gyrase B-, and HSP90-like ATPase